MLGAGVGAGTCTAGLSFVAVTSAFIASGFVAGRGNAAMDRTGGSGTVACSTGAGAGFSGVGTVAAIGGGGGAARIGGTDAFWGALFAGVCAGGVETDKEAGSIFGCGCGVFCARTLSGAGISRRASTAVAPEAGSRLTNSGSIAAGSAPVEPGSGVLSRLTCDSSWGAGTGETGVETVVPATSEFGRANRK